MNEVFTREALEQGVDQLVGKPVVIYANGKRRVIGEITGAKIDDSRSALAFTADITDDEVAGILGAAQDKNQAAASPIGLSDTEITGILASGAAPRPSSEQDMRDALGGSPNPFAGLR